MKADERRRLLGLNRRYQRLHCSSLSTNLLVMKGWSRCCGFVLAGVMLAAGAEGQPRFDVASVKPSPPPPGDLLNINLGTASHGVVTLNNTTLSECIRYAWGLQGEEQIDGPGWIRDRQFRYDIVAKAPPATAPDRLLQVMQALLTERFRLAMHTEPKRIAHLELSVAKGGPKMPQALGEG